MTTTLAPPPCQALQKDPHARLGVHDGYLKVWRPGAKEIWAEVRGKIVPIPQLDEAGLFSLYVGEITPLDYRVYHHSGVLTEDPYAFWPTFSEVDRHLFNKGVHYQLGDRMGARMREHQGVWGVAFSVWAPEAQSVHLVGDFNHWDPEVNPMRVLGNSGVWELFLPGDWEGMHYKYCVTQSDGKKVLKSDPYALGAELRPHTASVVRRIDRFHWTDETWMKNRTRSGPLIIYEVHLGSWRRGPEGFLNYRELAVSLAEYCQQMGYTHVELMPIAEHPLDESWGYQVTGYYAATRRHGTPEDFQWFVNHLHNAGIGVIIDWVPGHFPADIHGLGQFDGSCLYEHADPRQAWHPHWHTLCFNYARPEVSNFLIANALYWLEAMHVDGLRVDAVASMLYLDYGREPGQWVPNEYGGKENLAAIEFMKHCNHVVRQRIPQAMMIAEESTSWTGVTADVEHNGLGFTHKWNMGWMNDTLRYFARDPIHRAHHQNDMTFGMLYAFTERFCLVLSHDEVVHGKGALMNKMPGDLWQRAANVRLLLSYQACHPGKKLLFMGAELGQWDEWNPKQEIHWFLLHYPIHQGIHRCAAALNRLIRDHTALWAWDEDWRGFQWVDFSDAQNTVVSYLRRSEDEELLVVHHFSPQCLEDYIIRIQHGQEIEEIFNTDAEAFGGSGVVNHNPQILRDERGWTWGVRIRLAPLATMVFRLR